MHHGLRPALLLSLLLALGSMAHAADAPRTLDDFTHPAAWQAEGTDDISAALRPTDGAHGKAICLDFDFNRVSGGATLRRTLPITFPENYALSFDVRGPMPPNDLQLKLIDASGDNVWWYRREHFQPGQAWQTITAPKREIESAWGPAKDRTLRQTRTLEFTVYAGQGGRGELCVGNLRLTPLPPAPVEYFRRTHQVARKIAPQRRVAPPETSRAVAKFVVPFRKARRVIP